MGTPIIPPVDPDPSPASTKCVECWGVGKDFGNLETPIYMQVTFAGMQKGQNWIAAAGEPSDGTLRLRQSPFVPCLWTLVVGDNEYALYLFSAETKVRIIRNGLFNSYMLVSSEGCSSFLVNDVDNYFKDGTVEIVVPEIS